MSPFFFGTSERRIFGVYEPAASGTSGKRAAVFCYPWGSEYIYAHRTIRQLAVRLSTAGFHTLRFDFFGTGDSAGDLTDADLAGWETDVESAMEEIRDISGVPQVTLIGMRLGATIAASVAARYSRMVDCLILWDPIVSGEEYLRQFEVIPQKLLNKRPCLSADSERSYEIQGFPLTMNMMREFHSIDLGARISPPSTRTLMLLTESSPSHERLFPIPAGRDPGSLEIETIAATRPWLESSASAGGTPVDVIQRIVNWLE
jgi:pimeloyl-ACP methyl ester carboxylesterase